MQKHYCEVCESFYKGKRRDGFVCKLKAKHNTLQICIAAMQHFVMSGFVVLLQALVLRPSAGLQGRS